MSTPTGVNPYNPEKAKALLKEAGVTTPLELTMTLPPPPYARQGGEMIAVEAGQGRHQRQDRERRVGAVAVAAPSTGNYDLTIISHVEPLDFANFYAKPDYYWGYDSKPSSTTCSTSTTRRTQRRPSAPSCSATSSACWPTTRVNAFLYPAAVVTVANKKLQGPVEQTSPIFANDLSRAVAGPRRR